MNSITETTALAAPAGVDESAFARSITLQVIGMTMGRLETNTGLVLAAVREKIEDYRDISRYTGRLDIAKADRALLRKQKEAVKSVRKDIEARWNSPLEAFKATVKEIDRVYDEAIDSIDELVKGVEAQEKLHKRQAVQAYFDGKRCDLVSLDKIFNDKWLNKTCKMSDVQHEIDDALEAVYRNIKILENIAGHGMTVKALYLETLDMEAALRQVETLKANAERLAREQAEREERERREQLAAQHTSLRREQQIAPKEQRMQALAAQALDLPETRLPPQPEQLPLQTVTLRFTGTREALFALKAYMTANAVTYEKVD